MAKKFIPQIRYTDRDYNSIRNFLIEYARRYYPNIANDLSKNSSLALDIDLVSIVGDMLSFYLDYSVNELFLDSAVEYNNVVRNAEQGGYRFEPFPASTGIESFYVKIPASSNGLGPDPNYLPKLKRTSIISSTGGSLFSLLSDVDFSNANAQVVVAEVDETTGVPTSYAVKMYGEILSGELVSETITVGTFKRYLKLRLGSRNITEVVSIFDSEGHQYYEVPYLSQDIVFTSIPNYDADKDDVSAILKPISVPRRFVVRREGAETFIQFGHGSDAELFDRNSIDPANVIIKQFGREHIVDDSFDPFKLLKGDKLGISPANTTLTIAYRINTSDNVNADANTISNVERPIFEFTNPTTLNETKRRSVISSLEVTNEEDILGDVSLPTADEVKVLALGSYPTQNRAVTQEDCVAMIYRMPKKFGAVKRCNVVQDPDSFKRNLNVYIVSETAQGTLSASPGRLKQNLKTWINHFKMINDTVDILDARILNLEINYSILSSTDYDKYDVLAQAKVKLQDLFSLVPQIGEPFFITDVFTELKDIVGVVDVVDVRIKNKFGGSYSNFVYNIDRNTSADGRRIDIPLDTIWEIKFPDADIKGEIL